MTIRGEPRGCASFQPTSMLSQPFLIIWSAATLGSGNFARSTAIIFAARSVRGLRRRCRCSITASACSGSRTVSNCWRGVGLPGALTSERSEEWLSVEGNAPVSVLLLCTCTALAAGLLYRASAAAFRLPIISSAFDSSASIRLCFHPSENRANRISRLSAHSAGVSLEYRAIRRSSDGNPPSCQ